MSRRHFEAIAAVLRNATAYNAGDPCTRDLIARELADFLVGENPRFDRGHFLRACGVA